MSRIAALVLLAAPAFAHVMSMSSGDLTLDGARAHYELRMPLYEIVHIANPERALLDHIHFSGAQLLHGECRTEAARDVYICTADYRFAAPVETLDIECTFAAVTVPNHVHLLRAEQAGKRDQAIFDIGFTRATLRFRPPTPLETAITQAGAGAVRALSGIVQCLFLAALALAARGRRERFAIAAAFLAGQAATVFAMPHFASQPPPRFVEAATALALAYLAVEILFLPQARARWLIAAVLGALYGLYFHVFLQTTAYSPALVLSGAALAELAAFAILSLLTSRLPRRAGQFAAAALLCTGLAWFFLQMRA
jgi:hypothetical protein